MIHRHNINDIIEVISVNTLTFITATFTDIESYLKIILLLISIGYTCYKWISDHNEKKKRK